MASSFLPAPAPRHPPQSYPSPRQDDDFADEYASEDAFSDRELHALDTDYHAQRDFSSYQPSQNPNGPLTSTRPMQGPKSSENLSKFLPHGAIHQELPGRSPPPRYSSKCKQHDLYVNNYGSKDSADHRLSSEYQPYRKRRPLIDLIKNEWRNHPRLPSPTDNESFEVSMFLQICCSPKVRRTVFVLLMLVFLIWGNWKSWAGPRFNDNAMLDFSAKARMKGGEGWFGQNIRPEFADMIYVQKLDEKLMPRGGDKKRLIVIGDVHGCHEELVSLLAKVQHEPQLDQLVFAGDMIANGPASPAVVDLAISVNASCVRGNHEDRVLLTYRDLEARRVSKPNKLPALSSEPPGEAAAYGRNPQEETFEKDLIGIAELKDSKLTKEFSIQHIEFLEKCPVILELGEVQGMGRVHVVHAGLVPGIEMERQDPTSVMRMRTIDLGTHVPNERSQGTLWFKLWNKYQSLLPSQDRSTVIYGHDSKRGLQLHEYSKGLDTGCVKGGHLTALIIEPSNVGEPQVVSVDCTKQRKETK